MSARHARPDDTVAPAGSPLRLVDDVAPVDTYPPEVRAVLDAVALLHSAVITWATATAGPPSGAHDHAAGGAGRHRR